MLANYCLGEFTLLYSLSQKEFLQYNNFSVYPDYFDPNFIFNLEKYYFRRFVRYV
jgi:hypothetical protein